MTAACQQQNTAIMDHLAYVQASQRAVIADMTRKNGSLHTTAVALQQENSRLAERLRVLHASVQGSKPEAPAAQAGSKKRSSSAGPGGEGGGNTRARAALRNPLLREVRIALACGVCVDEAAWIAANG